MTQFLPPNLLALFAPRDPIPYLPPVGKLTWEKKTDGYTGIAQLISRFEDPEETPPPVQVETKDERLERKRKEKAEQMQYKLEQEIALWDPHNNESATTDPYKSLFVARINYDSSESKLRREFEIYGPIEKIVIVHNKINGKPRGYAFIEYEHERDMHSAYKHADGKKIDNRRVLVDVERSRTVKGWLPRRLGGGLGGTRKGGPDVNVKHSGREDDRKKGRDDDNIIRDRERGGDRVERDREERDREPREERDREPRVERDRDNNRADRDREPRVERDRDNNRGDRDRDNNRGDRDRDRGERRRRGRRGSPDANMENSRDRKRRRSRSRERGRGGNDDEDRRRHRSKSKERRRRSRSKDRKHRRDRNDRNRNEADPALESMKIKQEPDDDYPEFSGPPLGEGGVPDENEQPEQYYNYPMKDEEERLKNGTSAKFEEEEKQFPN